MTRLHYLCDKALADALQLQASVQLLREELGRSYGSLMSAGDLRDITRQRAEAEAMRDFCHDFIRYMGTPEAWAEAKQAPAGGCDLVAEANKMLGAMGPGGKA